MTFVPDHIIAQINLVHADEIPITPTMAAWDRRRAMEKTDPLLALAYFVEAAGDRRIENDQSATSLLTDLRDRAREMIQRHQGMPFFRGNPLYPARG